MSIFKKLLGRNRTEAPSLDKPKTHFAFVLLETGALPSGHQLLESFKKFSHGRHALTINRDENVPGDEGEGAGVLSLGIDKVGFAFVALMPAPVPNGEAEAYAQLSVGSFSEMSELKSHSAHLMVSLMLSEEAASLDGLMAFTSLLAATLEVTESVGVYWGNVGATHTRKFFLSVAAEADVIPRIMLWSGVSRSVERGNRMSLLSYGMSQLGLPDLYLVFDAKDAGVHFPRLFDLLAYVANRGEAIPAGDTIGASDEERVVVQYVQSPADSSKTVWKVSL